MNTTPRFPDGFHCAHGYPPGECCPACGEIPDPMAGVLVDDDWDECGSCSCVVECEGRP